ncbi:hypothetical protein U9M48_023802 [Paspalum notatum var. saurae]|uniref:Uncharacterized protein n=1 Tax=Paspalum notatum var. saurae TaxID=547442 RepID=A0AAQ3TQ46_PASNO
MSLMDSFAWSQKGQAGWWGQAPLRQAIRSPTLVVDGQPNKELAVRRCPTSPDPLPWGKTDGFCKHGNIRRLAAIRTRRGELPAMLVWDIRLQYQSIDQVPDKQGSN